MLYGIISIGVLYIGLIIRTKLDELEKMEEYNRAREEGYDVFFTR